MSAAAAALAVPAFSALAHTPASDVKKLGWRGVMRVVGEQGAVLVTNHDRPEAVILSTTEYQRLLKAAEAARAIQQDALQALRERFDERLASLQAPDAADRLRGLLAQPLSLAGQVRAGQTC
ncbi:type II toxin-antitoxin system Phd/YefM family antitoxin [Comamonas flocculans]|nr:type II toxin-antitoxin system Phd/YefM family antitoxin [Comamonas flocculans]